MNKYTRNRKIFFYLKQICLVLAFLSAIIFGLKTILSIGVNVVAKSSLNALESPVSILLIGGDTSEERKTVPLTDSIILLTINPKNERGNVSIDALSIPRDSRVEYACGVGVNGSKPIGKINSAFGVGYSTKQNEEDGIDCTVKTVENLLDTKIDYYAYTNFDGLIKIIDAIGGVDINVPYEFCEQDSKDQQGTVCLATGPQTLNGEQALAYARQRKAINPKRGASGDDWERNIRQQEVIAAIMKKILSNPREYAGEVFGAVNQGAIKMNIDLGTLSKLANFGVNLFNNVNDTLTSQGDLNLLSKSSAFNHKVALDSNTNVFGLTTNESKKTLADLYPEQGKNNVYYENTTVNYLNVNYKNTAAPTVKQTGEDKKQLTIELSMVTIGTENDPAGSSEQIIPKDSLEYYQVFVDQARNEKPTTKNNPLINSQPQPKQNQ